MIPVIVYPSAEATAFLDKLRRRGDVSDSEILPVVRDIIARVRKEGDAAVLELTNGFDCPDAPRQTLRISDNEIAAAQIPDELLAAIRTARDNIRRFHEHQRQASWFVQEPDGVTLGQLVSPLERVGIIVPSASAPLISPLTMASVPAKVAGVEELVVCLAPGRDGKVHPAMLVAARECGVSEVYACGGAQAIAAMAYGSESIRRVDKIVGPGNPYSQFAKKEVFGVVDTDKIAGPSEILVIADESATPAFIAADLISQAEHSEDCSSILVTTSREIADATNVELERQAPTLPRAEVIRGSFAEFGAAFLVENLDAAVELTNRIAPEHAEVHTRDAFQLATRLRNVGGIFVGEWAPEALGDYVAGPNHILPTGGTARFSSAMGVSDFVKTSNLLAYSATALARLTETVVTLAEAEGLEGHGAAMTVRSANQSKFGVSN